MKLLIDLVKPKRLTRMRYNIALNKGYWIAGIFIALILCAPIEISYKVFQTKGLDDLRAAEAVIRESVLGVKIDRQINRPQSSESGR